MWTHHKPEVLAGEEARQAVQLARENQSLALTYLSKGIWRAIRCTYLGSDPHRIRVSIRSGVSRRDIVELFDLQEVHGCFTSNNFKHLFTTTLTDITICTDPDSPVTLELDFPSEIRRLNRRSTRRWRLCEEQQLPAKLWMLGAMPDLAHPADSPYPLWDAAVVEVAFAGLLLRTTSLVDGFLATGQRVGLKACLPGDREFFIADVSVRHVRNLPGGSLLGVQFCEFAGDGASQSGFQTYVRFLRELQQPQADGSPRAA